MNDLVFVDTNILLYTVDEADPAKHKAARLWRDWLWQTRRGRTSFQVLQEFYANVWKKWPRAKNAAREEIVDLLAWKPMAVNGNLLQSAWQIQDRFGFSFWDSLIVAAAKASLCRVLLSEGFQRGKFIEGIQVVNPFVTGPDQL